MSLTVSTLSRREVVTHGAAGFPRARSLQRWHDTLNEEEGATPVALGLLDGGILVAVLLATCSRKRARCVALEVGRGVEIDVATYLLATAFAEQSDRDSVKDCVFELAPLHRSVESALGVLGATPTPVPTPVPSNQPRPLR